MLAKQTSRIFPTNIITNLKEHFKVTLFRSGRTIKQLQLVEAEPKMEKEKQVATTKRLQSRKFQSLTLKFIFLQFMIHQTLFPKNLEYDLESII